MRAQFRNNPPPKSFGASVRLMLHHLAVRNRGRGYMRAGGSDGFGYQAAILGHNIACVDSNYGRLTSSALYLYWTRSIPPHYLPRFWDS